LYNILFFIFSLLYFLSNSLVRYNFLFLLFLFLVFHIRLFTRLWLCSFYLFVCSFSSIPIEFFFGHFFTRFFFSFRHYHLHDILNKRLFYDKNLSWTRLGCNESLRFTSFSSFRYPILKNVPTFVMINKIRPPYRAPFLFYLDHLAIF
jgi:hypothetical protein